MKFAIVLAGCGVYDGAEIHEATLTMLAIAKKGDTYDIFAPNINQYHVVNHLSGEEEKNQTRNVLVESARIARGQISDLQNYTPDNYDALVLPGGYGVAKNLSDFAFKGADCQINNLLEEAIKKTHQANKIIAALCIAPVIVAKILAPALVTIGNDQDTNTQISKMNSQFKNTEENTEVIVDKLNKIYSTPCYMTSKNIAEVYNGIENLFNMIRTDFNK